MEGGKKNIFSNFISESELAEVKQRRQDEWEKNRKPGQPVERPEAPVDHRSLFERLQEQKRAKDEEYEKEHKLGNQIQKLDEGDVEFLSLVSERKMQVNREKEMEERDLMEELRQHRTNKATPTAIKSKLNLPSTKSLMESMKRKRDDDDCDKDGKKQKIASKVPSSSSTSTALDSDRNENHLADDGSPSGQKSLCASDRIAVASKDGTYAARGHGRVEVLGYLPGIGPYSDDSNSSSSSSNSDDEIDLPMLKKACMVKHIQKMSG